MMSYFNQTSTTLLGLLTVGITVIFSLTGMAIFRRFLRHRLALSDEMNNDVIFFASAISAFYGLTVGLIAVGVWRNYNAVQDIVSQEAAVIGSLYRDVSFYPEPVRGDLQQRLRDHTSFIIDTSWPAQRRGIMLDQGTIKLTDLQKTLYNFEPGTKGQELLHGEALRQFNHLSTLRRQRVEAVTGGLPSVMWAIVIIGAVLSICVTYLLEIEGKTHYLLVGFLATFTGLVIFVIFGLDNPLSGPVAIEPTAYQLVLDRLINLK